MIDVFLVEDLRAMGIEGNVKIKDVLRMGGYDWKVIGFHGYNEIVSSYVPVKNIKTYVTLQTI